MTARFANKIQSLYSACRTGFGLFISLLLTLVACERLPLLQTLKAQSPSSSNRKQNPKQASQIYGPPTKLADLEDPAIRESSGVVASRSAPGLYWTHNDSGDGPFIYAFDEQGRSRGVWRVTGAVAHDWEDIAAGPGPKENSSYLYIGDIGDNNQSRSDIVVYRVPEPTITAADARSSKRRPQVTEFAEAIHLRYPDGKHDAEALLVHPVTGDIYIITKILFANPGIYKAASTQSSAGIITLVPVGELNIPSLFGGIITGGDISPDGLRVALCDYMQGYELVLPNTRAAFDQIWKQPLKTIALGERKQGEAISYRLDGKALLATSEGAHSPLIQVLRR